MSTLDQTAAFIIHAIKQFCYGFETMNDVADDLYDGSPAKAFFLTAIYQHLAVFYLISPEGRPMGGAFYPALKAHNLHHLLTPISDVLSVELGRTTFGEVIRVFRNKVLVHSTYSDIDLDRIYAEVDMADPETLNQWHELLLRVYVETQRLGFRIAEATGRPPSDFGIYSRVVEN